MRNLFDQAIKTINLIRERISPRDSRLTETESSQALNPALKKEGKHSLRILADLEIIPQPVRMNLENLLTSLENGEFASNRHATLLSKDCLSAIGSKELDTALGKIIDSGLRNSISAIKVPNAHISEFYKQIMEAAIIKTKDLVNLFREETSSDPKSLANRLARVIPSDKMPVDVITKLLKYLEAPLSAAEFGYFIPIKYSSDMMSRTLSASNFRKDSYFSEDGLSDHAKRAVYLLYRRDLDTYDEGAMKQLIYGAEDPSKLEVLPASERKADFAVVAAIAILRPQLIEEHKLEQICLKTLPFDAETNKQFIDRLKGKATELKAESLALKIINSPDFFRNEADVQRYLNLPNPNQYTKNITVIAEFLRLKKTEDSPISLVERYLH